MQFGMPGCGPIEPLRALQTAPVSHPILEQLVEYRLDGSVASRERNEFLDVAFLEDIANHLIFETHFIGVQEIRASLVEGNMHRALNKHSESCSKLNALGQAWWVVSH